MSVKIIHRRIPITLDEKTSKIIEQNSKEMKLKQAEFIRRLILDFAVRKELVPELTLFASPS